MRSLIKMYRFVRPYRWQAALAMLLLVGVVAADLLIPRLTQQLIDDGIAQQDMRAITSSALLMLGAALLSALFSIGNTILAVRVGQNMGADLRGEIVHKVQTWSFGNLDDIQTGQLLVRATSDVNQVQTIFQMSVRILTRAPLWAIGSVIMLVLTSIKLALFMLALMPLIFGMIWVMMFKARPMFDAVQRKLDALNQVLQENLAGVRVVKAFVRTGHENGRFAQANDELTRESIGVTQLVALLLPTMQFVVSLGIVGVVWIGGGLVLKGDFAVGKMAASISYMSASLFPLLMLGGMIGPLSAADASAGRILEVLDSEPEVKDHTKAERPPARRERAGQSQADQSRADHGRIAFENVSFRYNGQEQEAVLKKVNLVAEPGETVALLGATGSGKSTLVHLIPRFYDVNEGRVTLDGVDVRDLPLEQLRAQMGVALQEAVLFTGTIRDNIRYGRPEATDEQVIAAAKAAQAHDFIAALPRGYDTLVGQRGVNLSGGQKQRISIARALLVQPTVLILDDSTSAVDVETEARIQAELETLMQGRTSFVIAQRISTVLNADKIVVLDEGKVTDVGTHEELLARSPIYREIYESQLGDGGVQNG